METMSAFHWTKNSDFYFRKLSVTNGTALSGISGRGQAREEYPNFVLGISGPFNFILGISGEERGVLPIQPKIPVSISVISSGISGKREGNFAKFTQIFANFLRGISVPSDILKFPGTVTVKSIRKLMNSRNAKHSTDYSETSGRKIKWNGNFR